MSILNFRSVGTRSLLFGVHQFAWHPFTVWRAWRRLYGPAGWRVGVCIVIHDWGYWGCRSMDGKDGENHPYFGAKIAGWLFGQSYYDLVLYHSRFLAARVGACPSALCWADKLSMLFEPERFYLLRARLSGEIKEYRRNAARGRDNHCYVQLSASDRYWLQWLKARLVKLAREQGLSVK